MAENNYLIKGLKSTLRPIEEKDFTLIKKWNYDPEITEFFTDREPISDEEQLIWFKRQIEDSTKKKFMIINNEDQACIGLISLINIDTRNRNCEIGITIGEKNYWGKNLAVDSMHALLKVAFYEMNMHMIYAKLFENNNRALKFFNNLGFAESGRLRENIFKNDRYISTIIMTLLEEEFISSFLKI